jgi:hypothetical protein
VNHPLFSQSNVKAKLETVFDREFHHPAASFEMGSAVSTTIAGTGRILNRIANVGVLSG